MKDTFPRKLPKNHEAVLGVIQGAGHGVHLTMVEVLRRARMDRPSIGFSTIYRSLQRLRDRGLVDEIHVPGSEAAVYELIGSPHAHFRCDVCGQIQDVAHDIDGRILETFERQTGSRIAGAKLTLHGQCRACIGG